MDVKASQNEVWEQIAKKIRFLLHNETITIKQMAERIGVELDYLKLVSDGLAKPTRHLLTKICTSFNLKMDYFESEVLALLGSGEDAGGREREEARGEEKPQTLPLPFTPAGKKRQAVPVGTGAARSGKSTTGLTKKKIQFNLAQMAAHHQALLECLIEKKLLAAADYQKKLNSVRQRAKLAKNAANAQA
jgi:transcriptional regulator with XRE-family HTH domain